MQQSPNNFVLVLNRRRNREIDRHALLSARGILKQKRAMLDNEVILEWKNRAKHLNQRDLRVRAEMNAEADEMSSTGAQLNILALS